MDRDASLDIQAQNFLKILGIVERTILPRHVLITNSSKSLALRVARQRASTAEGIEASSTEPLQQLASAITEICRDTRPIGIRLEPSPPPPKYVIGFTSVQIVNGQTPEAAAADETLSDYRFAPNGWPLAAPPEASLAMLTAAGRFAFMLSDWQRRHQNEVKPPMLVLAVSPEASQEISISVGEDIVVTQAGSAQLGQVVSKWQSQMKSNEKAGR